MIGWMKGQKEEANVTSDGRFVILLAVLLAVHVVSWYAPACQSQYVWCLNPLDCHP